MLERKIQFLVEWFNLKKKLISLFFQKPSEYQRMPFCKTGDMYYAYLGVNIGNEIDKKRPVLVYQSRKMLTSHLVLVIPITSKIKNGIFHVLFETNDIIGKKIDPGTMLIDQMRIISKQRLENKIGVISKEKIMQVKGVVQKILP